MNPRQIIAIKLATGLGIGVLIWHFGWIYWQDSAMWERFLNTEWTLILCSTAGTIIVLILLAFPQKMPQPPQAPTTTAATPPAPIVPLEIIEKLDRIEKENSNLKVAFNLQPEKSENPTKNRRKK